MLDIGWSEMAVIALLALVIIGPKDLPRVMRTMGKWAHKARSVSREFQSGIDDMIREAALFLLTRVRLVVEYSGAAALAALLSGVVGSPGRTAVIISGGNVEVAVQGDETPP